MPGNYYSVDNSTDTTIVTVAETVVATLAGVSSSRPGQTVRLHGELIITTGGSTTAVTLRVRRDGLTGALVGETDPASVESAAGGTEDHDIVVSDPLTGEVAGQVYVLTVQQTGAAANGSVIHASLEATLSP